MLCKISLKSGESYVVKREGDLRDFVDYLSSTLNQCFKLFTLANADEVGVRTVVINVSEIVTVKPFVKSVEVEDAERASEGVK